MKTAMDESAYDRGMRDGNTAANTGIETKNPYLTESARLCQEWEAGYRAGKDEVGYDN